MYNAVQLNILMSPVHVTELTPVTVAIKIRAEKAWRWETVMELLIEKGHRLMVVQKEDSKTANNVFT